jgi:hypothetical protein
MNNKHQYKVYVLKNVWPEDRRNRKCVEICNVFQHVFKDASYMSLPVIPLSLIINEQ